jgi:hypothetical protein
MKFGWWRGPDVHGALSIRGREVGSALQARASVPDGYGDTGFQASGIYFPVPGCYEVTGAAGGTSLSFVTLVEPCSALDELPIARQRAYSICGA